MGQERLGESRPPGGRRAYDLVYVLGVLLPRGARLGLAAAREVLPCARVVQPPDHLRSARHWNVRPRLGHGDPVSRGADGRRSRGHRRRRRRRSGVDGRFRRRSFMRPLRGHLLATDACARPDLALYIGYTARGWVADKGGHVDAGLESLERGFADARRAGLRAVLAARSARVESFRRHDPRRVAARMARRERAARGTGQFFRVYRAWSLARLGRFDKACAILAVARRAAGQARRSTYGRRGCLSTRTAASPSSTWSPGACGRPPARR